MLAGFVLLAASTGDAKGGSEVGVWGLFVLVLAALALIASLAGAFRGVGSRLAAVALGLFAAYAAWTFASILWSQNRGDAWFGAGLTLLYLLVFWLTLGLVSLGASRRWALAASAIGPAIIAAFTLARLVPEMTFMFKTDDPLGDGRLPGSVTYANAEAAFLLAPIWAGVYLVGSPRVNPFLRGAALAGAVLCSNLAVLTQSRGALVAMAASAPVFFLLSGQRLRGFLALVPIALALLVAFPGLNAVYLAFPDEESMRAAIGRVLPTVWLAAVGAGLCGVLWGLADRRWRPPSSLLRVAGSVALAVAVAVVFLGAVAFTWRVENPAAWGAQQWEEFKTSAPTGEQRQEGQGRLLDASGSGRYTLWQVAWEDFASHPLLGVGTHNYEATFYRLREQPYPRFVRQPHSLPLEVLAERGAVGGLLFFGFLAACLGAGLRERFKNLNPECKAQVGAMTAAVAYWFVHSSVEWFWQLPAVTLPAVIYLAMLAGPWQRVEAAPPRWSLRAVGAGFAALAMLAVAPLYIADHYLQQSRAAAADPGEALAAVERAQRFNPVEWRIREQEAVLAKNVGDWNRAVSAYREATRLNPDHFLPHTLLAETYARQGQFAAALSHVQEALALNPLDDPFKLNQAAITLLARAPVDTAPVRFMSQDAELGRLTLTVANDARERVLQGSEPLPPNVGVLLVWPNDTTDALRVEGATDPADVAFVNADGYINEIAPIDRPDEEVRSRQPYRLAIEANRGFFEEHGIGPGSRVVFAASL